MKSKRSLRRRTAATRHCTGCGTSGMATTCFLLKICPSKKLMPPLLFTKGDLLWPKSMAHFFVPGMLRHVGRRQRSCRTWVPVSTAASTGFNDHAISSNRGESLADSGLNCTNLKARRSISLSLSHLYGTP